MFLFSDEKKKVHLITRQVVKSPQKEKKENDDKALIEEIKSSSLFSSSFGCLVLPRFLCTLLCSPC
jgi:hypothetical protein